jgi:anti-sigma factor RsiW
MSMLHCKHVQARLSEFVDGTLPESETWEIRKHLASCSVCTRASAELAATVRLVSALPERGPSESFDDRLAARLADLVLTPRPPTLREKLIALWSRPTIRPAIASGLALAALVPIGFFVFRPAPVRVLVPTDEAVLTQIAHEHADYASSEPLADPSDVLADSADSEGL